MKKKCPICEERRGKRRCLLRDMAEICSYCCVEIRGEETCRECEHFIAALKNESKRGNRSGDSKRHFLFELNPEVEETVDALLQRAEEGETDQTLSELYELWREHPQNHVVCYAIGTVHGLREETSEAIEWFDKAIAINPFLIEAHFNKGVAFQKQLEVASSVRAFRKVLELGDPADPVYRQARSQVDGIARVIRKTEDVDLDTYLESYEEFDRAFALMEQKDWSGALAGFRNCLIKVERHAPTHGNMAICFAQLGRKAEALASLDRALEIDPDYGPALQNRGNVEEMEEGKPMAPAGFESVDYSREKFKKQRGR
jgi:tetratricopeptide (TPR) repeat protein